MIDFTGKWKGESVVNHPVDADELMEYFKLPIKDAERLEFRVSKIRKDRHGQPRYQQARYPSTTFSGVYNGSQVTIRIYDRLVADTRNPGKTKPYPARVKWAGKSETVDMTSNKEKGLLLYLSPHCKDSPIRRKNTPYMYHFFDSQEYDKKRMQKVNMERGLRESIFQLKDVDAIRAAKAFRSGQHRISHRDSETGTSAKLALIDWVGKDTPAVQMALHGDGGKVEGVIQHAIDANVIVLRGQDFNKGWYWKATGDLLCKVHANPHDDLRIFLDDLGKFENFRNKVDQMTAEDRVVIKEVKTDDPSSMVDYAVSNHMIDIDRRSGEVFFIDTDGAFVGDPVAKIPEGKFNEWRAYLKGMDHRKIQSITNAVKRQLNAK
jgi:hypothetical protein